MKLIHRLVLAGCIIAGQQPAGAAAPDTGAPLPATLSDEAKKQITLFASMPAPAAKPSVEQMRAFADMIQKQLAADQQKRYAVTVTESEIAGVPVRIIEPRGGAAKDVVLMNLHGGGFQVDSGSLTENIPLAALTGFKVVAVRYRLAPEHPYPAAVEDASAVYRELLKTHKPANIGVYGTSAGAILSPQLMMALRKAGTPLPGALGLFSADADFARPADTAAIFATPQVSREEIVAAYAGTVALDDPGLSPIYADLKGLPPSLCMASSRDFFLSSTANLCRKLQADGTPAQLVVFDGLPHAFWSYIQAPEGDEAFRLMANFFREKLARP